MSSKVPQPSTLALDWPVVCRVYFFHGLALHDDVYFVNVLEGSATVHPGTGLSCVLTPTPPPV